MIDITPIVKAILAIAIFIVSVYLLPLIRQKIGDAKTAELVRWVKIFVRSAEQIYAESGMGKQKKAYVLHKLQEKGYNLDLEAIEDMLEAAVLELNREAA